MGLGQGVSLDGFVPFPVTDAWRTDISQAPVSPLSSGTIGLLAPVGLHPDFGSGLYNGSNIGIPYNIVSGAKMVPVKYILYGSESDPGPMPIPANTLVEGFPNLGTGGDHHAIVLDRDNCFLYELDNAQVQGDGSWTANSGVVFDLLNNSDRPFNWTSTDAAGLPVFPGLARYDEVASGAINHALRFTVKFTRPGIIAPATHQAPNVSNPPASIMGMRFRLKAGFDTSGFGPQSRVILEALKKYGMIVADNGSNMYISGSPDSRWDNDDLHDLGKVTASDFDVVTGGPTAFASEGPPQIRTFKASAATVTANAPVTLQWFARGATPVFITPGSGAVRGDSVVVHPSATTTYTITVGNHAGRVSKTVTVNVK